MRYTITALIMSLFIPGTLLAFGWNGKTTTSEFDTWDGRIKIKSGHPLAAARAFRLANDAAATDAKIKAALEFVLGRDFAADKADGLQTVLFGSWLNEVLAALDMGSGGNLDAMTWVSRYMGWRYQSYLDGRERSDRYSQATGYSSANYLHCMMVTSIDPILTVTQDEVFDLIQQYTFWSLNASVLNLIIAKKGALEGSMSDEDIDLSWIAGLRHLGSVVHLIDDSAAACTPAAQRYTPTCVPGDGHTVVSKINGKTQVISLSDNVYYERKDQNGKKPHFLVDDLYRDERITEVFGDFDPAVTNSNLLIGIALAVDGAVHNELASIPLYQRDGTPNDAFDAAAFSLSTRVAQDLFDRHVQPRFAPQESRRPLPTLDSKEDSGFVPNQATDAETGGCATVPLSNAGNLALFAVGLLCLLFARRQF